MFNQLGRLISWQYWVFLSVNMEEAVATHSSILAWRIPWREDLLGYSLWGRKESDTTEWHTSVNKDCCSLAQSCPTLCDPVDCSTPGFPVLRYIPEFAQTHVHWVGDAVQPSHPLLSPSPPAFNLSQHQGLYQWVGSSHQVAKVLESQHQSFQWIFRVDFLSVHLFSSWFCLSEFWNFTCIDLICVLSDLYLSVSFGGGCEHKCIVILILNFTCLLLVVWKQLPFVY